MIPPMRSTRIAFFASLVLLSPLLSTGCEMHLQEVRALRSVGLHLAPQVLTGKCLTVGKLWVGACVQLQRVRATWQQILCTLE